MNLYKVAYFYNVRLKGDRIFLGKRWKVITLNGQYWLEFETTNGEWLRDSEIIIDDRQEFLNECM